MADAVLNRAQCERLSKLLDLPTTAAGVRSRDSAPYAARNLLWNHHELVAAIEDMPLSQLATQALGSPASLINATLFDKTPDANWAVPGHQDLMMPVAEKIEESGFTGWRQKLDVTYVEPPRQVLEHLVALRVHLDDCLEENGPLAVGPTSHRSGKLRQSELAAIAFDQFRNLPAHTGDVLVMKPLMVHRSSPAKNPNHRRVLHLVYASRPPGEHVRWKSPLTTHPDVRTRADDLTSGR